MRSGRRAAALAAAVASIALAAAAPAARRVEAQSKHYRAVALIDGTLMSIRLARIEDNAPVSNVGLDVTLRSATHPAIAQPDGSFQLRIPELDTPGEALVAMTVTATQGPEKLLGKLDAPQSASGDDPGANLRQGLWWVLNFAVCIGLLLLISRRRKRAAAESPDDE